MPAGAAPSPRAWCERAGVARVDRLASTARGGAAAFRAAQDGALRRVAEFDRRGTLLAALRWAPTGDLRHAAVRLPEMIWLAVEPRSGAPGPWGASDLVRLGAQPLTTLEALDWSAVDRIPALAEPARLPPHGGTVLLNLLASLAADQGRARLVYPGPWPTEALFLALLESFRYEGRLDDPLAAFMAGGLEWSPAPHARVFTPEGVHVQLRERVEKVVWRGRAYYRADWQGVRRRGSRVVRDEGGRVVCGLAALGTSLEDHLVLSPEGDVLEAPRQAPEAHDVRPLDAAIAAGVVALVAASSAPALGPALAGLGERYVLEWGPVAGDLAAQGPSGARLSHRLRALVETRLAGAATRADRLAVALGALHTVADLVGDDLRARAQRRLAAESPGAQRAALEARDSGVDAAALAAAVGRAAETWLSGSRGR